MSVSERASARAELGLALLEAGDVTAADFALRTSRAEFSEGQVRPSPDVLDVEVGLARVALLQGNKTEALALLDEALKYWHEFDPTGLDAAVADYWRARAKRGDAVSRDNENSSCLSLSTTPQLDRNSGRACACR